MPAPRSRRSGALAVAFLAATAVTASAEPTPVPTPSVAGLESIPGSSQREVTRLLAKVRRKYGDQAVVLQTQLLIHAMQSGAQRATGVRIDGFERSGDVQYLKFALETGLVFDDRARDRAARILVVWGAIIEPTLAHVRAPLPGDDALAIVAEVHHRTGALTAAEQPGTAERIGFYLDAAMLGDLRAGRVSARDLVHRVVIVVDGERWTDPLPATGWPIGPDGQPPS